MGWLESRVVQYVFINDKGDEKILEAKASEDRPEAPKGYKYKGFVPEKVEIMTKVQYEQNGRLAYRIDVGNGKHIHRSASRERYEHAAGNIGADRYKEAKRQGEDLKLNESAYTKQYGEKVKKAEKDKMDTHNRNLKKILKGGK